MSRQDFACSSYKSNIWAILRDKVNSKLAWKLYVFDLSNSDQFLTISLVFLGPGSYASENVKIVATVKDMMSNSFSTKVSNLRE